MKRKTKRAPRPKGSRPARATSIIPAPEQTTPPIIIDILLLPDELLLKIFCYFDYISLKYDIMQTCSRFRNVLSPPASSDRTRYPEDYILFRERPLRVPLPPDELGGADIKFKLHPFFASTNQWLQPKLSSQGSITMNRTPEAVKHDAEYSQTFGTAKSINDLADTFSRFSLERFRKGLYAENATSPAVTSILINGNIITNMDGVTIGDIQLEKYRALVVAMDSKRDVWKREVQHRCTWSGVSLYPNTYDNLEEYARVLQEVQKKTISKNKNAKKGMEKAIRAYERYYREIDRIRRDCSELPESWRREEKVVDDVEGVEGGRIYGEAFNKWWWW